MEKLSAVSHLINTIYAASDKEYQKELSLLIVRNNILNDSPAALSFSYRGENFSNYAWATISRPLHHELHTTMDSFIKKWEPCLIEKSSIKHFLICLANQRENAQEVLQLFPQKAGGTGSFDSIAHLPEISIIRKRILLDGL